MELDEARRMVQVGLELQDLEIADGFAGANMALSLLAAEADRFVVEQVVDDLRRSGVRERQFAARMLIESALPSEVVITMVQAALVEERDPLVMRWLVSALGSTGSAHVLTVLRRLSSHESSQVRFAVPDALSRCAEEGFDVIARPLLELSRDADADVRWSAAFELAAWLRDEGDPRIVDRFADAAATDPSEEVRKVAARALERLGPI